ncbi:MAG: GntR family transcriptional regulator, partial [Deltaproteobacteria bacterium]|nr:GntR family transcriptional regulator [Deltaproteobacteria bacterium]
MPKTQTPKYVIIKEHLLQGITEQRFEGMLPSENQLAKKFGVSRMTARKALQAVEREGF